MALPTSSTLGSPISLASAYLEVEGSAIANGSDITDTLIALADASTDGTLYFQVPNSAMTLKCSKITFSDYGITHFGCLESSAAVTIQHEAALTDLSGYSWTLHSGNVWKCTVGEVFAFYARTASAATSDFYSWGWNRALADVNAAYRWHWSANTLYIYSSVGNPSGYASCKAFLKDPGVLWEWTDDPVVQQIVIGTTTQAATRDDYKLTLRGCWSKWERSSGCGSAYGDGYYGGKNLITVYGQNVYADHDWYFRCNTLFPWAAGILLSTGNSPWYGCPNVYVSGVHEAGSFDVGYWKGTVHWENPAFRDQLGIQAGWLGGSSGAVLKRIAEARKCGGGTIASDVTNLGTIETQWGNSSWGGGFIVAVPQTFLAKYGSGPDDPFVHNAKDFGRAGPLAATESYGTAGTAIDNPWFMEHVCKFDGMGGVEEAGHRYIKTTMSDQYGATKANYGIFLENNGNDDQVGVPGYVTSHVVWTLVNCDSENGTLGYHVPGEDNGGHIDNRVHHMTFRGDGMNPAILGPTFRHDGPTLCWYDTFEYAQVFCLNISSWDDADQHDGYDDGSHNTIRNVVFRDKHSYYGGGNLDVGVGSPYTGKLCLDNVATNIKFIGTAREIIKVGDGSALDITNLRAPSGSTIVVGTSATVRIRKLTSDSWTILATGTITLTNGDLYYDPAADFPLTASDVPVTPSLSFLGVPSHPISDVVTGNWKSIPSGSLWSALDEETENDTDYIYTSQISDACEVALNDVPNPEVYTYHRLSYRGIGPYTVELKQNGTTIASWNENDSVMTTHVRFLTEAQAESITSDYTGFTVRITSN